MEGSRRLGRNHRRVQAGNWKWRPTHWLLDEEWKPGCIYHGPDLGQPTVWKLDNFGWESCHGVCSRDHGMGGRNGEAEGSRRHTGRRVERSGHVAGVQVACWDTLQRAGKGKGRAGRREHRRQRREQSQVEPESTMQGTRRHCQENKDLRSVKKMLKWRDEWEEEPTRKRKEEEAQNGSDSRGQGRITEVNLESNRQDVEWLPEEPEGSWGLESSEVCQRMGWSNRGGPEQQRWETGEYHHRERRNAETTVLSPKWARPVYLTAPRGGSAPVRHWASGWMNPIQAVGRESPSPRQSVLSCHMRTLGVGERATRGTSEASCPNRAATSHVEVGERSRTPQARKGWLHKTQGVSLHFSTKLHGESCQKGGCRATGWRGWEKGTA